MLSFTDNCIILILKIKHFKWTGYFFRTDISLLLQIGLYIKLHECYQCTHTTYIADMYYYHRYRPSQHHRYHYHYYVILVVNINSCFVTNSYCWVVVDIQQYLSSLHHIQMFSSLSVHNLQLSCMSRYSIQTSHLKCWQSKL